ncbi:myb-like protein X isoform X2 [Salvia divinorum]|uniref:Myb-like protein X isoform X2 n=1 Tax=Salvia divinorum TaxID=28513 RepID=A0ABD1FWJ2_SALDI
MSRCFPFPPPGYERKHQPEDLVLFKEAKRKEHEEKKEKKDKDRKKDKEKKVKDGNEKQRDKKDRKGKHKDKKEKHRDKKKDKEDQGKDKDKTSISEDSAISRKLEERDGEKFQPEGHNKHSRLEGEVKFSTLLHGQNGKNPSQSILRSQATNKERFVQELNRRIQDEKKGGGSQFLQRVADVGKRDQGTAAGTALWNPSQELAEDKNNDGDMISSFHVKKVELQGRNGEFTGKAAGQDLTRATKSENEGIPRPLEKQNDSRLEDKEKNKEAWGKNQGDKQKDRDKKSHGKDKQKEEVKKEKKNEKKKVKAIADIENKKSESKTARRNDLADTTTSKNVNFHKDVIGIAINEASIKKRKDMDTNGFLHEGEVRPSKVQRLSLHQSTENGRKLEASTKSFSIKHGVPNNVWSDHGGWSNNNASEANKPSPSKSNHPFGINKSSHQIFVPPKTPHPAPSNVNEATGMSKMKEHTAEASRKPPHLDSKYLSQVLAVPTVGNWSEDNDQEWLFSKKRPPNKPELEPAGVKEELRVWSEAVHIESADVCALPYVIPY